MKNIYIINEYLSSAKNGIGTYLNELLYCLQAMGTKVCLITFNADCKEFNITYSHKRMEMNFPCFPKGGFWEHPAVVNRFLRLHITDSENNVFFFNYSLSDKLMLALRQSFPLSKQIYVIHDFSWTGVLLGNIRKLKQIMAERKESENDKRKEFVINTWLREQQMMKIADKVVCLSKGTYQILKDTCFIEKQKLALIPNGLRDEKKRNRNIANEAKEQWREQLSVAENKKIVLFVGRTSKEKGFDVLLDAIRIVLKSVPHLQLVVAGSPSVSCPYHDIASQITYTGHIAKKELTKWYQIADMGVLPSYSEQCSYVGIEMMMYGLPVAASDGPGVRDMFHEGENATISRIRQSPKMYSKRLAAAIEKMLVSNILSDKLRQGARREYEQKYHIRYMRQKYKELIMTL